MAHSDGINPDLPRWMPPAAGRVLELGRGDGALAAAYMARNPRAHYTAIDARGPLADKAEAMAEAAMAAGGAPFEAIVLDDVLGHFRDADAVLARLRHLLAPDGHLVLDEPNIGHWSALHHLIGDRWPSEESGLFDRARLRFFTLPSLDEALTRAGWRVLKVRPRRALLDRDMARRWISPLADLAQRMGQDRASFIQRVSALRHVVVARKAERPATPVLHVEVAALAPRLLDARARLPAEHLESVPDLTVGYQEKEAHLPPLPVEAPKVLVIQRPDLRDPVAWTATLAATIRAGWLVVAELDDHPDLMIRPEGRGNHPSPWLASIGAHAVQTSTPRLAEAIRAHNPEVAVFPNAVFTLPPFPARADGPARVFYGALNREAFSGPVAAALAPAIAAHPDTLFTVLHDRRFFEMLPTARKRFLPAQPYDAYLRAMGECDIALMPLEGRRAETFKSDIKYAEAASLGVAAIASPAVYGDSIRDGETGLIAPAIGDWAPALGRLLGDPVLRRRIARAAWEEARATRMFSDQARARRDWYSGLWRRRAALEAALIARLPGLAERLERD